MVKKLTKPLLVLAALLWSVLAYSEGDTLKYYINYEGKKCEDGSEIYYRVAVKENSLWHVKDYYIEEKSLQMEGSFFDDSFKVQNGMFFWYHPNRYMSRKGRYINGKKEGLWRAYNEQGKLVDSSLYVHNMPMFVYSFYDDGRPAMIANIKEDGSGEEIAYYDNGTISQKGRYAPVLEKDSMWFHYYENGTISRREYFKSGILEEVECYDSLGINTKCSIDIEKYNEIVKRRQSPDSVDQWIDNFAIVMPEASYNVNKFAGMNIMYPQEAKERNMGGKY